MKTSGNTVLVTGGGTGIGFALAEAFVRAGNKVLICGRRKAKLEEAKQKLPQLEVRQCDLSSKEGRENLGNWVSASYPDLNILVNNAGVSRSIHLKKGTTELFGGDDEVQINFMAPVHLSAYFTPLFLKKKEAAIVNISSGLAFVPISSVPLYCASKAAVHSFSISLRHQLRDTSVKVFEVIPPIVDTDLGKGTTDGAVRENKGIPPSEVAAEVMKAFKDDEYEVIIAFARDMIKGSKNNFEKTFQELNQ